MGNGEGGIKGCRILTAIKASEQKFNPKRK